MKPSRTKRATHTTHATPRTSPSPAAKGAARRGTSSSTTLELELEPTPAREDALERIFEKVEKPQPSAKRVTTSATAKVPALRVARLSSIEGPTVKISFRVGAAIEAEIGDGVERALLVKAMKDRDAVLVEAVEGERPVIVGVVQTKIPREIELRGKKIHIEADDEVLLRAGTAALRLRKDGDVELVGSRLVAMSRGLFRLVGRVLRLN